MVSFVVTLGYQKVKFGNTYKHDLNSIMVKALQHSKDLTLVNLIPVDQTALQSDKLLNPFSCLDTYHAMS
jgi:hypothetical protein